MKLRSVHRRYLYLVIGGLLLITIGFVFFSWRDKTPTSTNSNKKDFVLRNEAPAPPATAAQLEKSESKVGKNLLAKKDYNGYQVYERGIASQYISQKDFTNADRIMALVRKNVPAASIQANSYAVMVDASKGLNDNVNTKEYLALLVAALNKEGRTNESQSFTDELGTLQ